MRCLLFLVLSILLVSVLFAQPQPPDTLWTRTFGGTLVDVGRSVQQTSDGGYIIAGYTSSYSAGYSDVYLIKTDSSGNQQWSRNFGGIHTERGYSVDVTSDSGYIIAGYTSSYGAGYSDFYSIKTDAAGNQQWSQTYGGNGTDDCNSVQQTSDGGYIVAGYTSSYGAGNYDIYSIKTDSAGNQQWSRTFGGSDDDRGYGIQQTSDGGYIIAGYTSSYGAGYKDVLLIKYDAAGNQQWSQTYGGNTDDMGYCVQQTGDGGYIITGSTGSYGAGGLDVYLIKTDTVGNQQWSRTFGGSDWDEGNSVQQTDDDGYIITGYSKSFGAVYQDVYIIKTDAAGNQQWSQTFGGGNDDVGYSVQQTSDSGYIIVGACAGGWDVYLIRLESETTLAVTLTPLTTPIQIPAVGGSFSFDAQIVNNTNNTITFDAWTEVILPNGNTYGPLILRRSLPITAGAVITRQITQSVPGNAPSGNYTYIGNVGVYPDSIINTDNFPFEKLAGEGLSNHKQGWAVCGWFGDESSSSIQHSSFSIHNSYPNPFNASTVISFELQAASQIKLAVYDVNGREVALLVDGHLSSGPHEIAFDGTDLPSGVYFAMLEAGDLTQTRKLILLK